MAVAPPSPSGETVSVSFIALTLVMTVCFLCMDDAANDGELLLPSITESVAVSPPFPVHSSPLREQSVVLRISLASVTGNMQRRWRI